MLRKNPQRNDELDRLGRIVLNSAAQNEAEADAAANSPFLFTRLRARIAAEQNRSDEGGWLSLLLIARRAVPVMAVVALLAGVLTIWTAQPSAPAVGFGVYEEALSDTTDPGVEQTVLSQNNLSRDDVLSIVVDRNERENR